MRGCAHFTVHLRIDSNSDYSPCLESQTLKNLVNCTPLKLSSCFYLPKHHITIIKVIIEKSRVEGSLMEQDTIVNVSQPIYFKLFKKKNGFLNFILCQKCFHHLKCF